jgi:hypothetical protein
MLTVRIANIRPGDGCFYSAATTAVLRRLPDHSLGLPIPDTHAQAFTVARPDGRFAVVEFTDVPALIPAAMEMPPFITGMAMQAEPSHEAVRRGKMVGGYFSRNQWTPLPAYSGEIDRLFFGGTVHHGRDVVRALQVSPDTAIVEGTRESKPLARAAFLTLSARHRVVLALPGCGFCFREFDALAGGWPLMMPPWRTCHRMEPLVPGEHYIAVEHHAEPRVFAARILDAFDLVRRDTALLERIGAAGRAWFERNCTMPLIADGVVAWLSDALQE